MDVRRVGRNTLASSQVFLGPSSAASAMGSAEKQRCVAELTEHCSGAKHAGSGNCLVCCAAVGEAGYCKGSFADEFCKN